MVAFCMLSLTRHCKVHIYSLNFILARMVSLSCFNPVVVEFLSNILLYIFSFFFLFSYSIVALLILDHLIWI